MQKATPPAARLSMSLHRLDMLDMSTWSIRQPVATAICVPTCVPVCSLQVGHVLLSTVPDAESDAAGRLSMYVGYLPEFDILQTDIGGVRNEARPSALVGLDLLGNTRIVLSVKSKKVCFKAKEANDVWAGQVFDGGRARWPRGPD